MRAITGAVVSSKPCSFAKAIVILARFAESAATHLPSSDAATYLRASAEAANDIHIFRRDLRRSRQRGGNVEAAHEGVEREGGESGKKHGRAGDQGREMKAENGVMALAAGPQGTSGEKKKGAEEGEENDASHGGLHSPASAKRTKKKERRVKEEDQAGDADEKNRQTSDDGLQNSLLEEGIDNKNSGKKKKHTKQEHEVIRAKEAEQTMVHFGISSEKKKRKKMDHTKEEEKMKDAIIDGDFGSDKSRKRKRDSR